MGILEIITVIKNDRPGLLRTIRSTKNLRKRHSVKQIIVDGSDVSLRKKNEQTSKHFKNVNYYWRRPKGIADAFNFGLSKVKSEWAWFLNGGDEIDSKLDVNAFLCILKRVSSDVLIFEIKEDGKEIKHPSFYDLWPPLSVWVPHPATVVRRKILGEIGGFNTKYSIAMDADLWLRLLSRPGVVVDMISMPITKFYPGGIHVDSKASSEMLDSIWTNRKILFRRCLNRFVVQSRKVVFYLRDSLDL